MTETNALSDLLDLDEEQNEWTDRDLREMLDHQLTVPLDDDCTRRITERGSDQNYTEQEETPHCSATFGEVLHDPAPRLFCLKRIKMFAQRARRSLGGPLPEGVAGFLYYGSILAAMARCGKRITSLTNEELKAGLKRVCGQDWIDADKTKWLRELGQKCELKGML